MAEYQVVYSASEQKIIIQEPDSDYPEGYVVLGSFEHDQTSSDTDVDNLGWEHNHVLFHHIRNLLYINNINDVFNFRIFEANGNEIYLEKPILDSNLIFDSDSEDQLIANIDIPNDGTDIKLTNDAGKRIKLVDSQLLTGPTPIDLKRIKKLKIELLSTNTNTYPSFRRDIYELVSEKENPIINDLFITYSDGVFTNDDGIAGQWYVDADPISGETGSSWTPLDMAEVYGRAIRQVVGGKTSNVIVLTDEVSPATHIDFSIHPDSPATKFSSLGYEMVDTGGQTTEADDRGVVTKSGILNNGSDEGPWGRMTGNLSGQTLGICVALMDTENVNHFNEIDIPLTSLSTSNPQGICPVVAFYDIDNFVWLYVVGNNLEARRYIGGVSGNISLPGGGNAYLRLPTGLTQHDKVKVEVRLGAMQVSINDIPYSFVSSTGTSEPADYWLPLPQALIELQGTKIGFMARGGAGARYAWLSNHWFGENSQSILIGSTSIYENVGEESAERGIQIQGMAWPNHLNNAEVLILNDATGHIVEDWQVVSGAPGEGTSFTLNVPLDLSITNTTLRVVVRDTVLKNEATMTTVQVPIYQTIFPYTRGINESFVNYYGHNTRENNIFDASMFAFDELTNATSVASYAVESGLDADGQVYTYPYDPVKDTTATRVFFRIKPGLKIGDEYIIRYPASMTASYWIADPSYVEVLQAPSGGTARIKILRTDDANGGLRLSGPIPPEGVGLKNVSMYKADVDPETAAYLGDDFKSSYAAGGWRLYRNMSADGLNGSYDYNRPWVNRAGQTNGALSARAWGEISYLNGGTDLYICLKGGMSDAFVLEFFEQLSEVVNPSSKIFIEIGNEVWNQDIGDRIYKGFMYEGVTRGFHTSPYEPIPSYIKSLYSEATNRTTGALKVPMLAGEYIYWDKNGVGMIMSQTLKDRQIGDIIDDSDPEEWVTVISNAGSWNAARRYLTRRTREVVAIADSIFPVENIIPVIAWQTGSFNSDRQQLFEMDDFYLELAARPNGGRYAIAPYWGSSLGVWNTERTWQSQIVSEDETTFQLGMAGFAADAIIDIDNKLNQTVTTKHQLANWLAQKGVHPDSIRLMSYECNWHVVIKPESSWPVNITNRFKDIITHPVIQDLNTRYAKGLAYRVGGEHTWFDRCRRIPSSFNGGEMYSWSLMADEYDFGENNYRLQGVLSVG